MHALTPHTLLAAWERGQARHPLDRALLLYAAAVPGSPPDALADRPLGQRNAALLRLHAAWFGDALDACVDCPRCGNRLEFSLSAAALALPAQAGTVDAATEVVIDDLRVRLPTTRDLVRLAHEGDDVRASQRLLSSLVEDELVEPAILAALAPRIESALEAADPCIDLTLNLCCPVCAQSWTASFDIASHLWDQIDVGARRLLDEVHMLARAYAWSEQGILCLSEARRTAYLERVLA